MKARAEAGVTLPDLPVYCGQYEGHAPLVLRNELLTTLDVERSRLDAQVRRQKVCNAWYGDLRKGLAAPRTTGD